ncbi:MAG: hypothetical protein FD167_1177 [bacterium]|nr:MAG: hypothetical protein FD167_1177 [bacterium]
MNRFEDIKIYLPKYLSLESQQKLFSDLEQFSNNIISKNFYASDLYQENSVFQGDGLSNLFIIDIQNNNKHISLPSIKIAPGPVMILSNTCDIDPNNQRFIPMRVVYCPIIKLSRYVKVLRKRNTSNEKIDSHLESMRKQEVTSIFYLPESNGLKEECMVLLDRINSCDLSFIDLNKLQDTRLFSLNNYGFYVFLFKLSIHISRVREGVDRK